MTRWIHVWIDDGSLEADGLFSADLANDGQVTDDEDVWIAYVAARESLSVAKRRVVESLRQPTDEERETYRARIVAELAKLTGGES